MLSILSSADFCSSKFNTFVKILGILAGNQPVKIGSMSGLTFYRTSHLAAALKRYIVVTNR